MTKTKDSIVVGGGIIGINIALELLNQGREVTLIEKNEPGKGCSYGHAGHYATEQIFPMPSPALTPQIPKMLLNPNGPLVVKPSFMLRFIPWALKFLLKCRKTDFNNGTEALKFINKTALEDWKQTLSDASLQKYISHKGTIEIFKTLKGRSYGEKMLPLYAAHDIPVQLLSKDDLKEKIPDLTPDQQGGLFFPNTGHCIDTFGITQALYKKFTDLGGNYIKDEVLSLHNISPKLTEIIMQDGKVTAAHVFICAGGASDQICQSLGYKVPLIAERGYHIMIPTPNIKLDYAITYHERKFVLTPMQKGIRLAGTVEFAQADDQPTYKRAKMLLKMAQEILPNLSLKAEDPWMGCRPTVPDYLPILDRKDNIYFAFAHNHLGFTQAATTAKIMVRMLTEQSSRYLKIENGKNPFRIDRF